MAKFSLLLLCFMALIFVSCKTSQKKVEPGTPALEEKKDTMTKTNNSSKNQDAGLEAQILGPWQWHMTDCCSRMPVKTFAQKGEQSKILTFTRDGQVDYLTGETKTGSESYKIGYGLMDDDRPLITIGERQPGLLYIRQDTLIIDYGYFDLQTDYYLRK